MSLTGMQLVFERRDDAEVAAAAAQRPEQILVFCLARDEEPAVGRHDVGRDQVVARQAERAREISDPAAERQAPRCPSTR